MKSPSERTSGIKDKITAAAIILFFEVKKIDAIKNNANKGSVSPENVSVKFSGAKQNINSTIHDLSLFSCFAVRYVKSRVVAETRQLNNFIPAIPNWENGALSRTNTGFAQ